MEMQTTCVVTREYDVRTVYGNPVDTLKPPPGFEFTGEFRIPGAGERWFDSVNRGANKCCFNEPRLILRPKPKTKLVTFEVPENADPELCYAFHLSPGKTVHDQVISRPLRRLEPKQ